MNKIKTKLVVWLIDMAIKIDPTTAYGLVVTISKQVAARERAAKKAATKTDV